LPHLEANQLIRHFILPEIFSFVSESSYLELLGKINQIKISYQHEGRVSDNLQTCGDGGDSGGGVKCPDKYSKYGPMGSD